MPPHGYLAFYAWLRQRIRRRTRSCIWASTAISNGCRARRWRCRPSAIRKPLFGPLPHLYPFIVNDPGEGTQAKRRTAAVIIDHLTPPLTRAESYGPLKDLEALVDEYYEASGIDPRRLKPAAQAHPRSGRATSASTPMPASAGTNSDDGAAANSTPIFAN